jgi:hypothetical protein
VSPISPVHTDEDTKLLSKTPGPGNKPTYTVLPGFDFDYTLPPSKTFGIVITGLNSNQFNEQHRWQPTWFASLTANPGSLRLTCIPLPAAESSPLARGAAQGRGGLNLYDARSLDGKNFTPFREEFQATVGQWVGAKVGLFASPRPARTPPATPISTASA